MSYRRFGVILLGCALTACGPAAKPADQSGVEGIVTIGPTCPVVSLASPCADRPFSAEISVRTSAGHEVASFHSGSDGRFRVSLPPGTYTLLPLSPHPGVPPFGRPVQVEVVAGSYTHVVITYDSGIRGAASAPSASTAPSS